MLSTSGARMELVCFLGRVALGAKPDHDHVSLLELVRAAVFIDQCFDFVVVTRDPLMYLSVEVREVGGVCEGLVRIRARGRKRDEVDQKVRGSSRVNLKGWVPCGTMYGSVVGEFGAREKFVPGGGVLLDEALQ